MVIRMNSTPLEPKDQLRDMLAKLGMGQREAARRLDIKEREFRRMCAGKRHVPAGVLLGLKQLMGENRVTCPVCKVGMPPMSDGRLPFHGGITGHCAGSEKKP